MDRMSDRQIAIILVICILGAILLGYCGNLSHTRPQSGAQAAMEMDQRDMDRAAAYELEKAMDR